ncbi:hypothetical protein [Bradyrhizobium sp.]|uniref:hypothetical protein n=1 Tax=Bradyrhizobium sp. TaxID=376 RepID=UPI003C3C0A9D
MLIVRIFLVLLTLASPARAIWPPRATRSPPSRLRFKQRVIRRLAACAGNGIGLTGGTG